MLKLLYVNQKILRNIYTEGRQTVTGIDFTTSLEQKYKKNK